MAQISDCSGDEQYINAKETILNPKEVDQLFYMCGFDQQMPDSHEIRLTT